VTAVLTAAGCALAVAVELVEALAIVLAVGVSRRWRDALIGAAGATLVCAAVAGVLGPVVFASVPLEALRFTIGTLLLLFGLEWLRKGTLRLAGRRSRSSAVSEYEETRADLDDVPLPPAGAPDWAGRAVAFKGVLLEGVEIVLIVSTLAARPSGAAPAIVGAAVALVITLGVGIALRRPLASIPETELKWGVGVLLTSFGTFFAGEGLHVSWPGDDAAIIYIALALGAASLAQSRVLGRRAVPA
jgi:Ca2+/H+ antiporter, TMEM165/GDT1 family